MVLQASGAEAIAYSDRGEQAWTVDSFGASVWLPAIKLKKTSWKVDERLYNHYISPLLGSLTFSDLDNDAIGKLENLFAAKDLASATRNRILYVLKSLMAYAHKYGLVDKGKFSLLENRFSRQVLRKTAFIDQQKLRKLYQKLQLSHSIPARIIEIMLLTGITKKEILAAKWEDFDYQHSTLEVSGYKGRRKKILLSEKVKDILLSIPKDRDSGWIFPGRNPDQHYTDLFSFWNNLRNECGLREIRIQDLRHNYTNWQKQANGYAPVLESQLENETDFKDSVESNKKQPGESDDQIALIGIDYMNPTPLRSGAGDNIESDKKTGSIKDLLKQITDATIRSSGFTESYLKRKRCGIFMSMPANILKRYSIEQFTADLTSKGKKYWNANPACFVRDHYKLSGSAVMVDAKEFSLWAAFQEAIGYLNRKDGDLAFVCYIHSQKIDDKDPITLTLLMSQVNKTYQNKLNIHTLIKNINILNQATEHIANISGDKINYDLLSLINYDLNIKNNELILIA